MCERAFCYLVFSPFNDILQAEISINLLDVGEERWTDFIHPLKAYMRSSILHL